MFQAIKVLTGKSTISRMLQKHFHGHPPHTLVTTGRTFPLASRVDVQFALDEFFAGRQGVHRLGLHSPHHGGMEAMGISQLLQRTPFPIDVGPLQYDDVDIGETLPARCVRQALWISNADGLPFAALIGRGMQMGMPLGVQVEIAVPGGDAGMKFSEQFFDQLEKSISAGRTYRGKVISLETAFDYTGRTGSVKVHRLRPVPNEWERREVLPWFFRSLAIRATLLCGEIYTTDTIDGGALWIRRGSTNILGRVVRAGLLTTPFRLGWASFRRCINLSRRVEEVHRRLARGAHWYLMVLGVEPSNRDALRKTLTEPVLSQADSEGLPCYLETFNPGNLPFFKELGFRIEAAGRIPGGPSFWAMVRAPHGAVE